MSKKISESKSFLKDIGLPDSLQTDMASYVLLSLAHIQPDSDWKSATNEWLRIHDIREYIHHFYKKKYAENTRETIRKNCIKPFREVALVEDNGKETNHPNFKYRLTPEALNLIRAKESASYRDDLSHFLDTHEALIEKYKSQKERQKMPVFINTQKMSFSPGKHNKLQKAVLEEYAPRFIPNARCLYVGDTTQKDLVKDDKTLKELGFEISIHDIMPDIILYQENDNHLYMIEAVTSTGPMSPERVANLKELTKNVQAPITFVTAFPDIQTSKKFLASLAWGTDIWLAEFPEHIINLD